MNGRFLSRSIEHITLKDFRCYDKLSLALRPESVVITGPNGSGKTNLLEAISFLIPGRGLRRARLSQIKNTTKNQPWSLFFQLRDQGDEIQIGTGLDPEYPTKDKRLVKINGEKPKSHAVLTEWVSIIWLTPQMDRLFLEGPQGRRRFLDRIVYGFDPAHAARLTRYERAVKERNLLLRKDNYDLKWMLGVEEALIQEGIAITLSRRDVIEKLTEVLDVQNQEFPRATLVLEGNIDSLLQTNSPQEAEGKLRALYAEMRDRDRQGGRTSVGPHCSDLLVFYPEKKMPAAFCSTGEQKALLLSIVMASAHLLSIRTGALPLLLLDEVVAHLDKNRRTALFQTILALRMQAWLTGTDVSLFEELQGNAQFLSLRDAQVIEKTE